MFRRSTYLVFTMGVCCFIGFSLRAMADPHPNLQRGFAAESFAVGDIDTVNLFNGNLIVSIPLGQEYVVSPYLSYQFRLVYNSNAFEYVEWGCLPEPGPSVSRAIADPAGTAGLGWTVSLGHLWRPGDIRQPGGGDLTEQYKYSGADGADHVFYTTRFENQEDNDAFWYTRDGSFLRLHLHTAGADTGKHEIEFPNGQSHYFENLSGDRGARLVEMRDKFTGRVVVSYDATGSWKVTDSTSPLPPAPDHPRIHKVDIQPVLGGRRGRVDRLRLATFNLSEATYEFLYRNVPLHVTPPPPHQLCPGVAAGNPTPHFDQDVLQGVVFPDGTSYVMPEYSPTGGRLGRLGLPLGGEIAWEYGPYKLPAGSCATVPPVGGGGCGNPLYDARTRVNGVTKRTVTPGDGPVGTWIYHPTLLDPAGVEASVGDVAVAAVRTVLQLETGVLTESTFSAYTGFDTVAGYDKKEFGLPYSRLGQWPLPNSGYPVTPAYRSTRTLQCPAGVAAPNLDTQCEVKRSTWLLYKTDEAENPFDPEEPLPTTFNPRLIAQRTLHEDDRKSETRDRYVAIDYSDPDDFGHLKQMAYKDNFDRSTTRTEITNWTPQVDNDTWLLNLFNKKTQIQGGSSEVQEFEFDLDKGFLRCQRSQMAADLRSHLDTVVEYTPNLAGQVVEEKWQGGDDDFDQTSGPESLCADVGPGRYRFEHGYSFGVRNLTTVPGALNLKVLDLTIDPSTGMAASARDAGGVQTTFDYDPSGRLTEATRAGDSPVTNVFNLDASPPTMRTYVGSETSQLEAEKWTFDGLGRIKRHGVARPGSAAGSPQFDDVTTTYNAVGWKTSVSDRGSSEGTEFSGFDTYGRPTRIEKADHSVTTLDYRGHSHMTRTTNVWNGFAEPLVSNSEWYDSRGQLYQVREPAPSDQGVRTDTIYHYDVAGRLTSVRHNTGGMGPLRTFMYDGRGHLVREDHPENGLTHYWYDARGNVVQRVSADGSDVRSIYDDAGRLTRLYTPQATLRDLTYGTDGVEIGRLKTATALNWRGTVAACTNYQVKQVYTYHPTTGRVAGTTTSLKELPVVGSPIEHEIWQQAYTYDGAGRITNVQHPNCVDNCTAPAWDVATQYSFGRSRAITGFATISYHPTGLPATISHANGVVYTQGADTWGMPRPGSIQATRGSDTWWPLEKYTYDGTGNIVSLGPPPVEGQPPVIPPRTFGYDARSRLIRATAPGLIGPMLQEYVYDFAGNLKTIPTGTLPVTYPINSMTNRISPPAQYNAAGSLLSYQGHSYTWDRLQQAKTTNTGSEAWTHTYDAAGERVWSWRTSSSRIDTYALRGQDGKVLRDFRKDSAPGVPLTWEDYVYREGQLLASRKWDGTNAIVQHFDLDHLGSVRLVTDASGGFVGKHDFWPYGEEYTPQAEGQQMKFTGHERDMGVVTSAADDVDYMHARYYKPLNGRFLSVDPGSPNLVSPQSWNRYSYGMDNPMRCIDPDGENAWDVIGGAFNAASSNMFLGVGRARPRNSDYSLGQAAGDLASVIAGAQEIQSGFAGFAGSLLTEPATSGASTMTLAVSGVQILHGSMVVITAGSNLATFFSSENESGTGSGSSDTSGLDAQLAEHEKKLADYRASPDANDNKGFLKAAGGNQELREKIIQGRIRNLESQIENFKRQIAARRADQP